MWSCGGVRCGDLLLRAPQGRKEEGKKEARGRAAATHACACDVGDLITGSARELRDRHLAATRQQRGTHATRRWLPRPGPSVCARVASCLLLPSLPPSTFIRNLFRSCLVPHSKFFYLSHRIFRHIHRTLNINKKN